tara:strand:+ start:54 stop:353 length:300 start_codon:yes stop_codon:yes gene_type:complete
MTNEMKLLIALCDALGFEVDTVLDYQEREVSQSDGHKHIERINSLSNGNMTLKSFDQEWIRSKDGSYFTMLVIPEVEYKLTKKSDGKKWGEALAGGAFK